MELQKNCTQCGISFKAKSTKNRFCCKHCSVEYSHSYLGRYSGWKNRTRVREKGFDLSFNDYRDLQIGDCVYCGVTMAGGIDRVDSSLGYTKENSVSSCFTCNCMKGLSQVKDFIGHIHKIHNHTLGKKIVADGKPPTPGDKVTVKVREKGKKPVDDWKEGKKKFDAIPISDELRTTLDNCVEDGVLELDL